MAQQSISINDLGSFVLLTPLTRRASRWFNQNIGKDNGYQPYWPTVLCERNYVDNILEGLKEDGVLA